MPSCVGAKGKRERNNIVIHNVMVHNILIFENIALALFVWIEFVDVPLNCVHEVPYLCPPSPSPVKKASCKGALGIEFLAFHLLQY